MAQKIKVAGTAAQPQPQPDNHLQPTSGLDRLMAQTMENRDKLFRDAMAAAYPERLTALVMAVFNNTPEGKQLLVELTNWIQNLPDDKPGALEGMGKFVAGQRSILRALWQMKQMKI